MILLEVMFSFFCFQPLGASDYLEISKEFHTVILRDIPQMTIRQKSEARRFITLIDTFYDNQVNCTFLLHSLTGGILDSMFFSVIFILFTIQKPILGIEKTGILYHSKSILMFVHLSVHHTFSFWMIFQEPLKQICPLTLFTRKIANTV